MYETMKYVNGFLAEIEACEKEGLITFDEAKEFRYGVNVVLRMTRHRHLDNEAFEVIERLDDLFTVAVYGWFDDEDFTPFPEV